MIDSAYYLFICSMIEFKKKKKIEAKARRYLSWTSWLPALLEKSLLSIIATEPRVWQLKNTYTMEKSKDTGNSNNQGMTYFHTQRKLQLRG